MEIGFCLKANVKEGENVTRNNQASEEVVKILTFFLFNFQKSRLSFRFYQFEFGSSLKEKFVTQFFNASCALFFLSIDFCADKI